MIRATIAAVLCFAGMLAYSLGYGAILNGDAFGVPFGWAFGSALTAMAFAAPLYFDRDDPSLIAGYGVFAALIAIMVTAALFGAGIILHASREYWIGGAAGALIGGALSYWAFGDDRKQRGVPRATGQTWANENHRRPEVEPAKPQALPHP